MIRETPRTCFVNNIEILEVLNTNYAFTIRDKIFTNIRHYWPIIQKSGKHYYAVLPTPLRFYCDYGRDFDKAEITYFSVGHPWSNGSLELFHSILLEIFRVHVSVNSNGYLFNIPYTVTA